MANIKLELAQDNLAFNIIVIAVPIILVLSLFHGCDVRHRSDKHDCTSGKVAACMSVGEAYASVHSDDLAYIFSMIFGYHASAKRWFGEACKLGDMRGCYRFGEFAESDGDDWFASSLNFTESLDAYGRACDAKVDDACESALRVAKLDCEFGTKASCARAEALGKAAEAKPQLR